MPAYAVQSPSNPMRSIDRGQLDFSFGVLSSVAIAASPTGVVRAAGGIVTLTTSSAHNFPAGESVLLADSAASKLTSVGGTRFGGQYFIQAVPSATTATLLPLDDIVLHQGPDTGGGGAATARAFEFLTPGVPTNKPGKAFALANMGNMSMGPFGFYVDTLFSADPGAFELDVQVAQQDAEVKYFTVFNGNRITVNANFADHFDANITGARFARAFMKNLTNAVGVICSIRV
jgi:hypothetical protein